MEEPGAFVVRAPFEQGGRQLIAEYAVPRVTWDEWRQANANRLDVSPWFVISTSAPSSLQSVEVNPAADSCGSGDIWTDSILSEPGPITGAYQAIWTGSLYVVIASSTSMARYDPVLDSWLPMSIEGAPVGRRPTAVWSGSEVILWGGFILPSGLIPPPQQLGGRYNPVTDSWIPFGFSQLSRSDHTAIWTGSRMIVFGGVCSPATYIGCEGSPPFIGFPRYYGDGFSFDPATNTFASIAIPGLVGRSNHSAVWTGSRMIVWGGFLTARIGPGPDGTGWTTLGDGGIYDPADNSWVNVPSSAVAMDRYLHGAVWDGSRMLVVGGASNKRMFDPVFGGIRTTFTPRDSVVALNPATGIWQDLGAMPPYALGGKSVFTGRWLLTWGSASGGRFDPVAGVWSPLTTVGAPVPRSDPAVAWDGIGMLVHGGNLGSTSLSDGGRYIPDPLSDADADADGFSPCGGDCDDTNPAVNPLAEESCNGLDDNCDGTRDEGAPGSGVACGLTDVGQCSLGVTECVDGALACIGEVGPQPEICNGLDDDCDSDVPAGELDADQDGYRGCAGDCDDGQAGIHPGATDLPGNFEDENCDGTAICSPESSWRNNGAFVLCVVNECVRLVDAGLVTPQQCHTLIAAAVKSGVGRPVVSGENGEGE